MKSSLIFRFSVLLILSSAPLYPQRTPLPGELADAVAIGDLREADTLLSRGADPDQADAGGQTPLVYAVSSGRFDLVERLLKTTANPDRPGQGGVTPLMMAVRMSREDLIVLLLSSGADPNLINDVCFNPEAVEEPLSAFSLAVNRGEFGIARRLFRMGADPLRLRLRGDTRPNPLNLPLLDIPLDARIWGDLADIRDAADSPDWMAGIDEDDPWRLHRAARDNDWMTARKALDDGAPVDAADDRGVTPLMCASWHGNASMVSLFLQRGADAARRDRKGRTALCYAASEGRNEIIRRLLSASTPGDLKISDADSAPVTGDESRMRSTGLPPIMP